MFPSRKLYKVTVDRVTKRKMKNHVKIQPELTTETTKNEVTIMRIKQVTRED